MSKLVWKNHLHGTGQRATLGPGFELNVAYAIEQLPSDAPKYNVNIFGRRLKERSPDLEHGKKRAIEAAKQVLNNALAQLE